jgi:hypothetical protein
LQDAEAWKAQASVFENLAYSAEARADSVQTFATERVRVVRERVVEVREVEVPASAQPFVAQRDSIIDELLVAVDEKDEAIEGYVTAAEFLRKQVTAWSEEMVDPTGGGRWVCGGLYRGRNMQRIRFDLFLELLTCQT